MELRYHQATHTMLTAQPIDTAACLKYLAESESAFGQYLSRYKAWTTFPLYQREPVISANAVQTLDDFEHRFNLTLPASVREWFSLDIGLPMLYTRGNWLLYNIEA